MRPEARGLAPGPQLPLPWPGTCSERRVRTGLQLESRKTPVPEPSVCTCSSAAPHLPGPSLRRTVCPSPHLPRTVSSEWRGVLEVAVPSWAAPAAGPCHGVGARGPLSRMAGPPVSLSTAPLGAEQEPATGRTARSRGGRRGLSSGKRRETQERQSGRAAWLPPPRPPESVPKQEGDWWRGGKHVVNGGTNGPTGGLPGVRPPSRPRGAKQMGLQT